MAEIYVNSAYTVAEMDAAIGAVAGKADKTYVDTELAKKQAQLVSGSNIKTINGQSLLGSGDISIALDTAYPVGSIYMAVNSTSPSELFGGTWEQIKDKFLLAAGDTYTANQSGGAATVKLTVDEMPSHTHAMRTKTGSGGQLNVSDGYLQRVAYTEYNLTDRETVQAENAGGSQAHNNMPPYLTVYVWKRTA